MHRNIITDREVFLKAIHPYREDIIDAVRCAMLIREQASLDQIGEETVSLQPMLTDPVFL